MAFSPILIGILCCLVYAARGEAECGNCETVGPCGQNKTCCSVGNADFCCYFDDGVCCEGTRHCCPKGFECDPSSNLRRRLCRHEIPARSVAPTGRAEAEEITVAKDMPFEYKTAGRTCPDGGQCDSSATCCSTGSGHYGCCPFENGVCCSDLLHCCPEGYSCNASGLCLKQVSGLAARRLPKSCPNTRSWAHSIVSQ